MKTIEQILSFYRSGQQVAFLAGRSVRDVHLDDKRRVRPLAVSLSRAVWTEFRMATFRFSMAEGLVPELQPLDAEARKTLEKELREAGAADLLETGAPTTRLPVERAVELLRTVLRVTRGGRTLPPLLLVFDFAEDLLPAEQPGNDHSIQLGEFARLLAQDYPLRAQKILILFSGSEAHTDPRVLRAMHTIHLAQPARSEKLEFLRALLESDLRRDATMEPGLDEGIVANIAAGLPNLSLESLVLASARTRQPLTSAQLVEQKREDVLRLSEGTLAVLDTSRVRGVHLVGRTIAPARRLLTAWAQGLMRGDECTPPNVILAGAAATGKTDLALSAAEDAHAAAYQLLSPKGGLVGQTERQARVQMRVLRELSPCFGFVDEVTECFPMRRGGMNLDAGASDAVTAELLNALSDRSREGRSIIAATTNRPWAIDAAMASRFVFLPVLMPLRSDYPAILASILTSMGTGQQPVDFDEPLLREAAAIFFEKGLSPRVMRAVIVGARADSGSPVGSALALEAAKDACEVEPIDRLSAEFADLWALRYTTRRSFFPWTGDPEYPIPDYLQGIVRTDGSVDGAALQARIDQLKPHAKL